MFTGSMPISSQEITHSSFFLALKLAARNPKCANQIPENIIVNWCSYYSACMYNNLSLDNIASRK
jgi:hypothetical protein